MEKDKMDQKENINQTEEINNPEAIDNEEVNDQSNQEEQEEKAADNEGMSETDKLKAEVADYKDKYIRLYSEFENFRRRTSKEKLELSKSAGEDVISALLTIIDDFERSQKAMEAEGADLTSVKEGVNLIYDKLNKTLEKKGLKVMEVGPGSEFNVEYHEAITQIPAPEEKLKGKVVDVIEKGYILGDKIIRFAKVVTGA
jgi:molecular chaperone GrpE